MLGVYVLGRGDRSRYDEKWENARTTGLLGQVEDECSNFCCIWHQMSQKLGHGSLQMTPTIPNVEAQWAPESQQN